MTQPHLLEQAKQGDPRAIAALMNKSLQPKGMTAYVERHGDHLEVVLKADRIPNRQSLTDFVERGIQTLAIPSIKTVRVAGQQIGAMSPAWEQDLFFEPFLPEFASEPDLSAATVDASNEFGHDMPLEDSELTASRESIHDLSELQELLSGSINQTPLDPLDPQRQELESRLESLWSEQSDEAAQDFLTELMADEPQDTDQQFESFLIEQSDDRFQSQEQEGLWIEPSEDPDLLSELNLDDSRAALSEQLESALQQLGSDSGSDSSWLTSSEATSEATDAEATDDEPDEILLTFLDDSPQTPSDFSLDETGEPIDEADEVLLNFLTNESDTPALSQTVPLGEISNDAADEVGLPDTSSLLTDDDLLLDSSEIEDPDLLLALTGDTPPLDSESTHESILEPTPLEPEPLGDRSEEDLFNQPADNEFTTDEFSNSTNELSLGVNNEPDASQIDFSASQHSAATNDTTESWDPPPIEFLQSELEATLPEMPTDQYQKPLVDPIAESDAPSDRQESLPEFPPDFLQEFQESPVDQSEDLYVVPQSNPFIEQMQGQDNNQFQPPRPEDGSNADLDQFDQTDWMLDESDLDTSDQPQGLDESLFQFSDSSDPLSDEALIDFFGEEPIDGTSTGEHPAQPDRWSQPVDDPDNPYSDSASNEAATQSEYLGNHSSSSFNQEFPGSALMGDESQLTPYNEFSADSESSAEYPDTEIPEPSYTSSYPDTEIPEPSYTSSYPDTEIPEPLPPTQVPDPNIPAYEEPSQEALEQQLAEFDLENSSTHSQPADELMTSDVEASPEPRRASWLFPLILLGISGWIVGLISFAFLWSRLSSPPPTPETVVDPAAPEAVASPNAAPTLCPSTADASGSAPIGLTSLQFQPTSGNPQQINLIGCVTNRTSQPIDLVSISYRAGAGNNAVVGGLNLPNSSIVQPGQTVPFTSKFTLPSDVTGVTIDTVYWQPSGQTTSREAAASINLNR